MTESSGVLAYVGLGSNLGEPLQQLRSARSALAKLPRSSLLAQSRLYCGVPMGPQDQPDYLNAVVALETLLSPIDLLRHLQAIETTQGREREGHRWGPRTLDLDLLLYGEQVIQTPELTVPHPGLDTRNFVLVPLSEIARGLSLPDGRALSELSACCSLDGLVRLDEQWTTCGEPA